MRAPPTSGVFPEHVGRLVLLIVANPATAIPAACYTQRKYSALFTMRVTVIGTGYVGAVTGACLAYLGHRVTCVDTDEGKISRLRRGEPTIYEPYLAELLQLAASRGGIDFDTDLSAPAAASDVIFIAVGTPSLPSGEANLAYLEAAAHSIGAAMDSSRFRVVVNKSIYFK